MTKTTDLDRIIASAPINKGAAVVAGGKGETWRPMMGNQRGWQADPLPVVAPVAWLASMIQPRERFGRLTVIGYGGKRHRGSAYVVRCVCGMYGYRTVKSLRNPVIGEASLMCERCQYLERLKAGEVPSIEERDAIRALAGKPSLREASG